MAIRVKEVASPRDRKQFIRFPLRHYPPASLYVPHLLAERKDFFSDSNPIFDFTDVRYLLAEDAAGRVLGRVTAHINHRHNEYWDERTGFFGFFECVDDVEAAKAMMAAVEEWLAERGMERVRGPFNFSTNEECGFLAAGFDKPPAFMMPYNPPYYLQLMDALGYRKVKDLVSWTYDCGGQVPAYLERFGRRAPDRLSVTVRSLRMNEFDQEVARAFRVYNEAWSDNWGFVPMSEAEFAYMARSLRPVVDPEVAIIAEVDGEPVGFSLALPDYNPVLRKMRGRLLPFGVFRFLLGRRKLDRVRVITMGVVEEHRRRGVDILMIYRTFVNGIARGYYRGEFGWILEENELMLRALERMGAHHDKTYRIVEKDL